MTIKLETHWFISRVYSPAMGKNLVTLFFKSYDQRPEVFEGSDCGVEVLKGMRSKASKLKAVDDVMVARVGGPKGIGTFPFPSADEYYAWASPKQVLNGVKR